jgi:hypothetical protein
MMHDECEWAKIVDAVDVICMLVRIQNRIEPFYIRAEKLVTQVGRCVDQNACRLVLRGSLHENGATPAPVLGV